MKSQSHEREFVGSSRVRRKSRCSSEVLSELIQKSRSLLKKLIETRQEDHREVQELVGGPLEHYREIIGSLLEDRRKKPRLMDLFSLVNVLKFVVSTQLVWNWASSIRDQLGLNWK